uniref:ZP domain-containing protein n=1 Tax=Panagrolaimus superbus TaxID=310955 RepID=A0A914YYI6_9BILA
MLAMNDPLPSFLLFSLVRDLVSFFAFILARDFDNRVTGTPIVECEKDFIKVTVPTLKPFKGKVFVKGEYSNKDCVKYYGSGAVYKNNRPYGPGTNSGFSSQTIQTGAHGNAGFRNSNANNGNGNFNGNGIGTSQMGGNSNGRNEFGNSQGTDRRISGTDSSRFGTDRLSTNSFNPESPKSMMNHGTESSSTNSNGENNSGFLSSKPNHRPSAPIFIPKNANNNNNKMPSSTSSSSTLNPHAGFQGLSSTNPSDDNRPLFCPPCENKCSSTKKNTVFLDDSYSYERDGLHIINPRRRRNSDSEAALEVKLGTCNARRDRTINPAGIHVSFTIVVNFHENFITKVDKAYHIACSYEEADRSVATQIDVSPPPETDLQGTIEPPKCQYSIQGTNGKSISHVLVGETVEHLWKCFSANGYSDVHKVFGLLVHNCFIEDGQGKREKIIDEQGCSLDPLVIGTPEYSSTSLSASIKALVVKFPDRDFVDFQCAIHMCVRDEGNCNGITPPNCGTTGRSRRHIDPNNITLSSPDDDWKLHAQRLTVMDIDSKVTDTDLGKLFNDQSISPPEFSKLQDPLNQENLCVSVLHFGLLIASTTFLFTICLTVLIGLMYMRNTKSINF